MKKLLFITALALSFGKVFAQQNDIEANLVTAMLNYTSLNNISESATHSTINFSDRIVSRRDIALDLQRQLSRTVNQVTIDEFIRSEITLELAPAINGALRPNQDPLSEDELFEQDLYYNMIVQMNRVYFEFGNLLVRNELQSNDICEDQHLLELSRIHNNLIDTALPIAENQFASSELQVISTLTFETITRVLEMKIICEELRNTAPSDAIVDSNNAEAEEAEEAEAEQQNQGDSTAVAE